MTEGLKVCYLARSGYLWRHRLWAWQRRDCSTKTNSSANVGSMLVHRLGRWPHIGPTLAEHFVFTRWLSRIWWRILRNSVTRPPWQVWSAKSKGSNCSLVKWAVTAFWLCRAQVSHPVTITLSAPGIRYPPIESRCRFISDRKLFYG